MLGVLGFKYRSTAGNSTRNLDLVHNVWAGKFTKVYDLRELISNGLGLGGQLFRVWTWIDKFV